MQNKKINQPMMLVYARNHKDHNCLFLSLTTVTHIHKHVEENINHCRRCQYLKIHLNQPHATTHHLTAVTMHLLAGNNLAVFELERLERSVSSYLQMTDEHLKAFRYTLSLSSRVAVGQTTQPQVLARHSCPVPTPNSSSMSCPVSL